MSKNLIIDYNDFYDRINNIISLGVIKKEEPIGYTNFNLPIEYFVAGSGEKDIVVTGATHGCEIITTDFLLNLMEDISKKSAVWDKILHEFKFHFIPILNPEGYLISTSAIRKIIDKDMPIEKQEEICKEYYLKMKEDITNPIDYKRYQEMFSNVDYTCINEKYNDIRNSVKNIMEKYTDLPKGCLQIWSANGSGIDIQANNINNPVVERIMNGENVYMKTVRYNNINYSHPGPINCPFDKEKGFKLENETKVISDLLERLNKNNKLFMYLNYHSAGGVIFQRPAIKNDNVDITDEEYNLKTRMNYIMAKAYSSRTIYNNEKNYSIYKKEENPTSSNDYFRLKYPNDLLVELSPMGGNPIAPYGDIENNYKNVIKSNIEATKFTLYTGVLLKKISEEFSNKVSLVDDNTNYDLLTEVEDMIFSEFDKKSERLGM